jgi:hypothetical protein
VSTGAQREPLSYQATLIGVASVYVRENKKNPPPPKGQREGKEAHLSDGREADHHDTCIARLVDLEALALRR